MQHRGLVIGGEMEQSVLTGNDRFVIDSLFTLPHTVRQMAGVSIKDRVSEATVAPQKFG